MKKLVVTVIGLGVIGGSYAMALTAAGHTVYGTDTDPRSVREAKDRGMIADGSGEAAAFAAKSDVVVIALYPAQVKAQLAALIPHLKDGAVVTDVAGIKSDYVAEIEAMLPKGVQFVFAHPMAGREKRGIDYADSRVFKGANFILVPTERTSEQSLETVRGLAEDMGFGNIMSVSAQKHDEIIAFVSQLPHAIAVALVNSDEESAETEKFIGDSYRDLTRIASINETLWSELFLGNRENLLRSISDFEAQLDRIKTVLERSDKAALEDIFRSSSARRQRYAKK